jgi:hypothetical protein
MFLIVLSLTPTFFAKASWSSPSSARAARNWLPEKLIALQTLGIEPKVIFGYNTKIGLMSLYRLTTPLEAKL